MKRTNGEIHQAFIRYANGEHLHDIAPSFGVSKERVRQIFKKHLRGIMRRVLGVDPFDFTSYKTDPKSIRANKYFWIGNSSLYLQDLSTKEQEP